MCNRTNLLIAVIFLLGSSAFASDTQNSVSHSNDDTENSFYWTPERFQHAIPKEYKADIYSVPSVKSRDKEQVFSSPGSPPTINVEPNNNKLFETSNIDTGEQKREPRKRGAFSYFTSSRALPATAAQNSYPFRATGKLFFSDINGDDFVCSASVIAFRLIITAGHCVYDAEAREWHEKFVFIPAYHKGRAPYNIWHWSWVTAPKIWTNGDGKLPNNEDFAIIQLKDRGKERLKIGEIIGWYGVRTNSANPNHLTLLGYPGSFDKGEWMHRVDAQQFRSVSSNTVEYGSDMRGGSSGGPWIQDFGQRARGQRRAGGNFVVSVTSYSPIDNLDYSGGSILNNHFWDMFQKACKHRQGNCK